MKYAVWAFVALLILPAYAGAAETCERNQPPQAQQAQQPQRGPQQDSKGGRGDQGRPPLHWWTDAKMRAELGITDQQSAAVEQVWQQSLPKLRDAWHRLNDLEKSVSQMIQDVADEPSVTAQIEKLEATRAEMNQARMLMLYRMYKLLKPEQRGKVMAMYPPIDDHRDGRRGGK